MLGRIACALQCSVQGLPALMVPAAWDQKIEGPVAIEGMNGGISGGIRI